MKKVVIGGSSVVVIVVSGNVLLVSLSCSVVDIITSGLVEVVLIPPTGVVSVILIVGRRVSGTVENSVDIVEGGSVKMLSLKAVVVSMG